MPRITIAGLMILPLFAAMAACAPDVPKNPADTSATSVAPAANPDINEKFLSPDLDVDRWIGRFEGESREVFRSRKAIVSALGLESGMAIGDIGAGTGLFTRLFASAVGDQGAVHAVEISTRFAEHLREMARRDDLSQGLHQALQHHFEFPGAMLESLMESLRPGGRLIVIDFERIPGQSKDWIVKHVRAGKGVFESEIVAAGFEFTGEIPVAGLEENYMLGFRRP